MERGTEGGREGGREERTGCPGEAGVAAESGVGQEQRAVHKRRRGGKKNVRKGGRKGGQKE